MLDTADSGLGTVICEERGVADDDDDDDDDGVVEDRRSGECNVMASTRCCGQMVERERVSHELLGYKQRKFESIVRM